MNRWGDIIAFPGIAWNFVDCEVLTMSTPIFPGFGELKTINLMPDHDLRNFNLDMNTTAPHPSIIMKWNFFVPFPVIFFKRSIWHYTVILITWNVQIISLDGHLTSSEITFFHLEKEWMVRKTYHKIDKFQSLQNRGQFKMIL